jgi:hypothetical protein
MDKNKLIAPIIISVVILLYYLGFIVVCLLVDGIPLLIKILGALVPLLLAGVMVYVLVERIKEIKSGEEDDLSKY